MGGREWGEGWVLRQRTRCKKPGKTDLLSRLTVEIRQSMSKHSTMLHMNLIPLTATKWRECGGSSIINSRSTCWLIVCSLLTEWVPALSGQAAGCPKHCIVVWWCWGGGIEQCCSNFDRWVLFLFHSTPAVFPRRLLSANTLPNWSSQRGSIICFSLRIHLFHLFGGRSQCLSKNCNWNRRLISSQISPGTAMLNRMLSYLMLFAKCSWSLTSSIIDMCFFVVVVVIIGFKCSWFHPGEVRAT